MGELKEPISLIISPMFVDEQPLLEDLVGTARTFAEHFMHQMQNSTIYQYFGIKPDKSYLLYGKPGTGKTMSVRAINNQANQEYLNALKEYAKTTKSQEYTEEEIKKQDEEIKRITEKTKLLVFSYDIGNFGTAYINRGSRIIQSFFNTVFEIADNKLVLIQLDEADALLQNREGHLHSEDRKNLETIMKNLQTAHEMDNVYVVLMTNYETGIDSAAMRAGRIDRKIKFELPNYEQRREMFEKTINKKNEQVKYALFRKVNYDNLAELSEGMNYADLQSVVELALKRKIDQWMTTPDKIIKMSYVTGKVVEDVLKQYKQEFYGRQKTRIGF